jgi:hypothetical protein
MKSVTSLIALAAALVATPALAEHHEVSDGEAHKA